MQSGLEKVALKVDPAQYTEGGREGERETEVGGGERERDRKERDPKVQRDDHVTHNAYRGLYHPIPQQCPLYMKILELLITIKIYRWMRKNFLEQRQW
jgi:hypothetical protein